MPSRSVSRWAEFQLRSPRGGLLCEVGRCRPQLEDAYPELPLLWLDTEDSEGEVFWIAAADL